MCYSSPHSRQCGQSSFHLLQSQTHLAGKESSQNQLASPFVHSSGHGQSTISLWPGCIGQKEKAGLPIKVIADYSLVPRPHPAHAHARLSLSDASTISTGPLCLLNILIVSVYRSYQNDTMYFRGRRTGVLHVTRYKQYTTTQSCNLVPPCSLHGKPKSFLELAHAFAIAFSVFCDTPTQNS